jgi:hypothetical protein
MMPCLCGDTHCPSCGPAQGNWQCPFCRAWADDPCEHMFEDGTDLKPEWAVQLNTVDLDEGKGHE